MAKLCQRGWMGRRGWGSWRVKGWVRISCEKQNWSCKDGRSRKIKGSLYCGAIAKLCICISHIGSIVILGTITRNLWVKTANLFTTGSALGHHCGMPTGCSYWPFRRWPTTSPGHSTWHAGRPRSSWRQTRGVRPGKMGIAVQKMSFEVPWRMAALQIWFTKFRYRSISLFRSLNIHT